VPFSR
jgi:hypothetical protein